jgi:hypothetical protein
MYLKCRHISYLPPYCRSVGSHYLRYLVITLITYGLAPIQGCNLRASKTFLLPTVSSVNED